MGLMFMFFYFGFDVVARFILDLRGTLKNKYLCSYEKNNESKNDDDDNNNNNN